MASLILMPKVGITVESCIITKWHKKKGDQVKTGDLLFSYETDKASIDEEAKEDGVLLDVFNVEGDDVPCLQGIAVIGNAGEDYSALVPSGNAATEAPAAVEVIKTEAAPAAVAEATPAAVVVNEGFLKASPRAKALAVKKGVDLKVVPGTGPYGRIVEKDVLLAIDSGRTGTGIGGRVTIADLNAKAVPAAVPVSADSKGDVEIVKFSNIRKVISKSMMTSLSSMAQLTNNSSFDATAVMNYRKVLKNTDEELGLAKITLNDIILYAVSRTIKNHKDLNAHLINDEMHYYSSVHLGIAVDTPRGLLVPTLFNADKLSLAEISVKAKAIIKEAQAGTISPDLLSGATFTITNLGTLGVESFTPVINPPQTGILGVCSIVDKVRIVDGQVTLYPSMGLSLTYDHRAVDGAPAGRFVQELKKNLENFTALLAR